MFESFDSLIHGFRSRYHWGPFLWGFIHTISVIDNSKSFGNNTYEKTQQMIERLHLIQNLFPCSLCKGKYVEHLEKLSNLNKHKEMALFYWSVDLHNDVNRKLGKREWSYEEAKNKWCVKYNKIF